MLSMDERTGNVLTTVAVFLIAAAIIYLAHGAFFILLLSLLFAYLLEPAVVFLQQYSRLGRESRTWAIAQVYLAGALVLVILSYELGPHLVRQIKSLNTALPQILERLSEGKAVADLGAKHGLDANQQERIQSWFGEHKAFITGAVERVSTSLAYLAARSIWVFVVPVLAIFILRDGRQLTNDFVETLARGERETRVRRIIDRVDAILAQYIRAQLALAGLSFVFYSSSMLVLKFPYALALGFLGGVLEFLPAIGWVASAATILTVGFLTHAHWIWMSGLLLLWRLIQDYVNSPRIMGSNLRLQPLTVLFALMVGGQVGGVAGLYFAVPTVAVLRILWMECGKGPACPLESQQRTSIEFAKAEGVV